MLLVPLFAIEETDHQNEYELEDDNKYEKEKVHVSDKIKESIEKKIINKIAKKEISKNREFDKKTAQIKKKLKKISALVDGLHKRLSLYSKTRKNLKVKIAKMLEKKKNAILKIKQFKLKMKEKITKVEVKALNKGKTANPKKMKALQKAQRKQARTIVKRFNRKMTALKRQAKHLESKKTQLRTKIAHLKGVANTLRAKLVITLKKKADYKKKMTQRRETLLKKALRHVKVFVMLKQMEKHLKHVEQRLAVVTDEKKREKLNRRREYLMKKQKRLQKRVDILNRRKAERKARKVEINKTKEQIKTYLKKYHAERKLKKSQLRAAKRNVRVFKRQFKKAERQYNNAKSLKKRERKATALKGARLAYFNAKTMVYTTKKDLRDMKNISIQKIHAILRGLLKLKIIDAQMKITEHKLSIKEYEQYKKKVVARLTQLKKFGKRLDLCPANQHLLKKQIKLNTRRLTHVARKIAHSYKAIRVHEFRIGMIHKKLRMIAIKEYKHMKGVVAELKQVIKELKTTIRTSKFKAACSGALTRKRMNFVIKKAKNEIKSLRLEMNDFKLKIKTVDEAIAEEKRQRLTVTKIDYHRVKAALEESKHGIRKLTRKIQKNKESATAATDVYKRKQFLMRNAKLALKIVKLDKINKTLINKVEVLKVKYDKMKQAELSEFLARQTKWETRKAKVIAELEKLAKSDSKITGKLHAKICKLKRCRLIYSKKANYLKAHKLQIILFKINQKLETIHSEYVRRGELKSFSIIKRRFGKQHRQYVRVDKKLKHSRHQLTRLEKKITAAEQKLPYLPDNEKVIAKGIVKTLEKIKSKVQKNIASLERNRIIIMKKYLALNKQYIIQLKKRIDSDKKRKEELVKKRPEMLKTALYELIPAKQQRAERKLDRLDKELEALDKRSVNDLHSLKESIKTRQFLKDAVKPKVVCSGGVINCEYCHSLARIVQTALKNREEDRVILERLHHRCNKETPQNQTNCLDVALRLAEYAVKVFDPVKFKVGTACKKIGVCGI